MRVLFVSSSQTVFFIDTQLMICRFYQSCSASSQSPSTFLEPSVLVLAQEWLVFFFKQLLALGGTSEGLQA